MKKLGLALIFGLVLLVTACNDEDEGYPLGNYWVGFGVLDFTESDAIQIVMDNDDVLIPVSWDIYWPLDGQHHTGARDHLQDGDRVLVNYTILDDEKNEAGEVEHYFVKVNRIQDILMKGVMDVTPENADSLGYDPIIVDEYWLEDSLLTFKLQYWGENQIHYLNLVKEPGELTSGSQPIELELRHNANNDEESYLYNAYVSFSLNNIRIDGLDSVEFVVNGTDYDGNEFRETGVFNYSNLD